MADQPINVRWFDPSKGIMLWTMPAQLTWENYALAQQRSVNLRAGFTGDIFTILDVSQVKTMPPDVIQRLPQMAGDTPSNMKLQIIVGLNRPLEVLGEVFALVYGRTRFADSIPRALDIIAQFQADHDRV